MSDKVDTVWLECPGCGCPTPMPVSEYMIRRESDAAYMWCEEIDVDWHVRDADVIRRTAGMPEFMKP